AAVEVADLVGWRRAHLRPDEAVLAVSGPVERREVLGAVRGGVGEWRTGAGTVAAPPPGFRELPAGLDRRRILVHRPGVPETVIQVGAVLPGPGDPDWTPLAVLDGVLASRPEEPLVTVHPPGAPEGIVAGAATSVQRRAGPGLFQARAAVRVGVAADVVRGLLAGIAEAGRDFPSPSDVGPVRERLARSFRAQATVPVGAAALLAANRVMGLPDSLMASYPRRVRRVGPQEVRDAAAQHLDTSRVSVVVVGDATLLRGELEAAGAFDLVDARGDPLAAEDLEVPEESPALDASLLEPTTLRYRMVVQGQELGTVTRALEPGPDSLPGTMVFRSETGLGGREVGQSVTFTREGFRPVAARSSIVGPGGSALLEVSVAGGRVLGRTRGGPTGERSVDMPLPDGALVGDMLELASWLVPLDEGASYRFPVVAPDAGRTSPVILRVGPVEEVTVPAGTFRARLVETSGAEAQRYWIRIDGPRVPVRIEQAGRPVALELVSTG
ncbi:MAG: insulinase family protein, partial [Gemmatimonadota bacterium]